MAFSALDHLVGLALRVPFARSPVVVLILELHPADLVHLFVDELLVTGCAVFGRLEQALREDLLMLPRVGPDQEVGDELRGFALEQTGFARVDLVGRSEGQRLVVSLFSMPRLPIFFWAEPRLVSRWSVDRSGGVLREPLD